MNVFWIIFSILCGILALFILISVAIYLIVFFVPNRSEKWLKSYHTPPGKIYDEYRPHMVECMKEVRAMPHKEFSIVSYDGIILKGKYYECKPGAPIELMMHGYRGCAESDLSIGVKRAFELGHNVLLVDHRSAGYSQGNIITFGVKESVDCADWVKFIINTFGSDVKIILTGISMGASTALIAAGKGLPENVVGVIADCGYTSAEDIIKKILKRIHLPIGVFYWIIKTTAKLFSGVNLDEANAFKAIANCKIPVALFHGNNDQFVPHYMSEQNYNNCNSKKHLLIVEGAGHGLCYIFNKEGYIQTIKNLKEDCGLE